MNAATALATSFELDRVVGSATASPPRLRLVQGGLSQPAPGVYLRRRLFAAVGLVLALFMVFGIGRVALSTAGGLAQPTHPGISGPTVVVEAQPGDSLWSIARRVHPDADVRPMVDAMVADRGGDTVVEGQRVMVPVG